MNSMDNSSLEREAEIFSNYLLKVAPNAKINALYSKAVSQSLLPSGIQDQKLLTFATNNAWSIGLLDSGLAFIRPHSEVRRRLYILFALLESMPAYHDYFLPKKRSPFYLFVIAFHGTSALIKAVLGIILIKILEYA